MWKCLLFDVSLVNYYKTTKLFSNLDLWGRFDFFLMYDIFQPKKRKFLKKFPFTNVLIELGWKDIIKKRKKKENCDSHIDALNKQTIDQLELVLLN